MQATGKEETTPVRSQADVRAAPIRETGGEFKPGNAESNPRLSLGETYIDLEQLWQRLDAVEQHNVILQRTLEKAMVTIKLLSDTDAVRSLTAGIEDVKAGRVSELDADAKAWEMIQSAVKEEREACARIAEDYDGNATVPSQFRLQIARLIRARSQPTGHGHLTGTADLDAMEGQAIRDSGEGTDSFIPNLDCFECARCGILFPERPDKCPNCEVIRARSQATGHRQTESSKPE
jgi:rubrerythrin